MKSEPILALLRVIQKDGAEQIFPITRDVIDIGRVEENNLTLPEKTVSRHHARLLYENGQFLLMDTNSSNGTFVGDFRLAPGERYLITYGEAFRIESYTLRLEQAPETGEEKPPAEPQPEEKPLAEPPTEEKPPVAPVPHVRLGVIEAPPPPPPTQRLPSIPAQPPPDYGKIFGLLPEQSRYLQYLPPIYSQQAFLGRFLMAFEEIFTPIEQAVDNFDLYLDPATAPEFFLDRLAAWLGTVLDERWPAEKRRAVLAEATSLYRQRGTRRGLSRCLEICTDLTPEIVEPKERPHHFNVILRVPPEKKVDRTIVERIVEANKPAHATYTLEVVQAK